MKEEEKKEINLEQEPKQEDVVEVEKAEGKVEYKETEVVSLTIDFDALDKWVKPESDDIPVCSFLDIYEAVGFLPHFQKYVEESKKQLVALDNIYCNFYTMQRMKNYIKDVWETHDLDIIGNNQVVWKEDSNYGKASHYKKTLQKKIEVALSLDFANFCPGLDDDLEDNVIVFRTYEKVGGEETHENNEAEVVELEGDSSKGE